MKKQAASTKKLPAKAVFVVPPGTHILDMSGPAQVFYEAAEAGAPISLHFISPLHNVLEVPMTTGFSVSALGNFKELTLGADDFIFIPGVEISKMTDRHFIAALDSFFEWINAQHKKGTTVCSVCTGAFFLAQSGLLDGKEATTHWKFQKDFAARYPRIEVLKNRLFVHSDRVYCSAGMSSGIDLALHLLQMRYGHLLASDVAREVLIYFRRGEEDPQLSVFVQYRNHINDRIHLVQDWLIENMNEKVNLTRLGKIAHTSPRHLTRAFKTVTGITIGSYVKKLRKEHATNLLKEGAKVDEVAMACGFRSTNQLRSLLRSAV